MSMHTFHPFSHEHGLADGCPRCEEHATHPFESLDRHNLSELIRRVKENLPARSRAEADAMRVVSQGRKVAAQIEEL